MKFRTDRLEMLRALRLLARVVSRRSTLPILSTVRFSLDGETLSLITTDLDSSLRIQMQVETGLSDQSHAELLDGVTVSMARLLALTSALAEPVFYFDASGPRVEVGGDKYLTAVLYKYLGSDYPVTPFESSRNETPPWSGQVDGLRFRDAILKTAPAAAEEENRSVLMGVLLETQHADGKLNGLRFVATNTHRMHVSTIWNTDKASLVCGDQHPLGVIVPAKALQVLADIIKKVPDAAWCDFRRVSLTYTGSQVKVSGPGFDFVSRILDGTFPPYRRLIPNYEALPDKLEVARPSFLAAMRWLKVAEKGAAHRVIFRMEIGKHLTLTSERGDGKDLSKTELNEDAALCRAVVPDVLASGTNAWVMDWRFVDQAVRMLGERVIFHLESPLKPLVLTSPDRPDDLCLIMGMTM